MIVSMMITFVMIIVVMIMTRVKGRVGVKRKPGALPSDDYTDRLHPHTVSTFSRKTSKEINLQSKTRRLSIEVGLSH